MPQMNRLLLLCCVALVWTGCRGTPSDDPQAGSGGDGTGEEQAFVNVGTNVAFVGDAACFDCHEEQYRGYQTHGMARSFYRLTPENVVEDFSGVVVRHEASGYYYRPFREGDRFYQEEYRLGPDGKPTHRLVREIAYVVGSGTAARTYLTESNGRLYEMPLTWYTQKRKWDFSPGYREHNSRFDRLIPDRCMVCHNSYPEPVPFVEGKYGAVPHGIGCERCHGPGARHIEERLASPEAPGDIDRSIVNPAHLSLDRRLDVCQQCHLSTTVSILREGRTAYDFRPAQALDGYVALFAAETPADENDIPVISHADRMKQSPCFIATRDSGAPMDCVTCHNPHEGFRDKGPAYFNQTCQTCHPAALLQAELHTPEAKARHAADANCITCHMPKVEAEDAPHSDFTDHKIRVVEDVPSPPFAPSGRPVKLVPYFDAERHAPVEPVYEGMAYVIYGEQKQDTAALRKGVALLEQVLAEEPGYGEAQFLLGLGRYRLGQAAAAIPALEAAVRADDGIPERLNALAQAYEAARRDPARIAGLYERALAIQPDLADVRVNYGRFLETQGRIDEAMAQYAQAAREQPWLAQAHYNLGTAYLRRQAFPEAEEALRRALELEPLHQETLGNLGLLYAMQGDTERAGELFERAVVADPGHPVALANLGAFYLNQGAAERAIPLLQRVVQADPYYTDALANLALAFFQTDRFGEAQRYAEQALQVDPSNRLARQILDAL